MSSIVFTTQNDLSLYSVCSREFGHTTLALNLSWAAEWCHDSYHWLGRVPGLRPYLEVLCPPASEWRCASSLWGEQTDKQAQTSISWGKQNKQEQHVFFFFQPNWLHMMVALPRTLYFNHLVHVINLLNPDDDDDCLPKHWLIHTQWECNQHR